MDGAICHCIFFILLLCHPLHSLACQASHGPIKAGMLGQIHPLDVTAFDAVFVFECEPVSRWRNAECDRHKRRRVASLGTVL